MRVITQSKQGAPQFAHPASQLIPGNVNLAGLMGIPPSKMFLIRKSLSIYQEKNPDSLTYDASQGDGGASLPGIPEEIFHRALEMQIDHGSAYDQPYGTELFRRAVIEDYWEVNSNFGIGPENVIATVGGRDALQKAYQAMLTLGYGCQGDAIVVSRVPWISYVWGPYGIGGNVLLAPGNPENGWAYTEDSIVECNTFASHHGRRVAGLIITSPDNPTGNTLSIQEQASLAKAALENGVAFVLFDWIYHFITDENPYSINEFFALFTQQERERIIILDGITKSLGGSNIRNAHLIASKEIINFISARASHAVFPSFFGQAVAMAAFEKGFINAARKIIEPTNASRKILKSFLDKNGFTYILGKGYYAFINVGEWLEKNGWEDSSILGKYLAEEHGLAIIPGSFSSEYGRQWIRFSYATPPEKTLGAAQRLKQGLDALD